MDRLHINLEVRGELFSLELKEHETNRAMGCGCELGADLTFKIADDEYRDFEKVMGVS